MKAAAERGMEVSAAFAALPKSQVGKDFMINQSLANQAAVVPSSLMLEDEEDLEQSAAMMLVRSVVDQLGGAGQKRFQGGNNRLPQLCGNWIEGTCGLGELCAKRPCCGAFAFPELDDKTEKELTQRLQVEGPRGVRLDLKTKAMLKQKADFHETNRLDHRKGGGDKSAPSTLHISNLKPGTDENIIKCAFSKFPGVIRVSVVDDDSTKRPFAFVEFSKNSEATFVLGLGKIDVDGSPASLAWAKSSTNEPSSEQQQSKRTNEHERKLGEYERRRGDGNGGGGGRGGGDSGRRPDFDRKRRDDYHSSAPKPVVEDFKKRVKSEVVANPLAPKALLAALNLRNKKGLDDDD